MTAVTHSTPSGDDVTRGVLQHRHALYRRALRLTKHRSDALDLVQDTLERALRTLPRDYPADKVRGWLFVTVRNLHIDRRRAMRRHSSLPLLDTLAAPEPGFEADKTRWRQVDDQMLAACLLRLDPRLREVYVLRVTSGLSLASIGARLGLPTATVGTRMHRARARLRALLTEADNDALPLAPRAAAAPVKLESGRRRPLAATYSGAAAAAVCAAS